MGFTEIIIILLISGGNVAVVKATNCWQTTVTVHYTVGPSVISVTRNDASTIMNQVLSHGKNQLSCSGLTLELLNVTIATPGNLYSISGNFGVIYGNKDGSQKQIAEACRTNARIFVDIVLRPYYYISPLNGNHLADSAAFTNYQDTTCSINGVNTTIAYPTTSLAVPTTVAVVKATNCWQTTVTVHYTVGPSVINVTQSDANTIMNQVLSHGKNQLSCSGLALELLNVTIATPGNLYSISCSFGIIYGNKDGSQKQTAKTCLTNARIFHDIVLRPYYYISPLNGSHFADSAAFTNYQDTTCSINGVQITTSSTSTIPEVPTTTGVQSTTSSKTTLPVMPTSTGVKSTASSPSKLRDLPTTAGVQTTTSSTSTLPDVSTTTGVQTTTSSPSTLPEVSTTTVIIGVQSTTSSTLPEVPTTTGVQTTTPSPSTLPEVSANTESTSEINPIWLWICFALLLVIAVIAFGMNHFKKRAYPIPNRPVAGV